MEKHQELDLTVKFGIWEAKNIVLEEVNTLGRRAAAPRTKYHFLLENDFQAYLDSK